MKGVPGVCFHPDFHSWKVLWRKLELFICTQSLWAPDDVWIIGHRKQWGKWLGKYNFDASEIPRTTTLHRYKTSQIMRFQLYTCTSTGELRRISERTINSIPIPWSIWVKHQQLPPLGLRLAHSSGTLSCMTWQLWEEIIHRIHGAGSSLPTCMACMVDLIFYGKCRQIYKNAWIVWVRLCWYLHCGFEDLLQSSGLHFKIGGMKPIMWSPFKNYVYSQPAIAMGHSSPKACATWRIIPRLVSS